mgnify:FL=1
MKTREDIESFLIQAEVPYQEVKEGLWVLQGAGYIEQIVVHLSPPVLVFRVHVMSLPKEKREELFRTLLELNSSQMVHGAYGVEGEKIVIVDSLQIENLDFNEFRATIDDMTLAVADHYSTLSRFRDAEAA